MSQKYFRPSLTSFLPYLALDLFFLAITITLRVIYFFASSSFVLLLAIFFLVLTICSGFISLVVATKRTIITDSNIEAVGLGFHSNIYWKDVERVQIIERIRGNLPYERTDRLILIYSKIGNMLSLNSNAWPKDEEDEFMGILCEMASKHNYSLLTETAKCLS